MIRAVVDAILQYNMLNPGEIILCGISGGADSMAMLGVLRELSGKYAVKICAGHFNHGLRGGESERDAEFVRDYCAENGIRFYCGGAEVSDVAAKRRKGIEETARELRYAFLSETAREIGAMRIATAHTADDNTETVLLNLLRGTGIAGLCGIPPVRGNIIRPLIKCTREQVEAYLKEKEIPHVEDSTNTDIRYKRNNIRHNVIPALREIAPDLSGKLSDTCCLLRYDRDYLDTAAENELAENSRKFDIVKLDSLHFTIASRVIKKMIEQVSNGTVSPSFTDIISVLRLAESKNPSARITLTGGFTVSREYTELIFGDEKNGHEITPCEINLNGVTKIDGTKYEIFVRKANKFDIFINSVDTFYINCDNIFGKLVVRSRKSGDMISLYDTGGTKTLKKLFIDKKIPRYLRSGIPVIADDRGVIAVYGAGTDKSRRANDFTGALRLEIKEASGNGHDG